MRLLIILVFSFITIKQCTFISNLLVDYFNYKNVQLVTVFTCCNKNDAIKINKAFAEYGIRSSCIQIETFINNYKEINETTNTVYYDSFGFILDLNCPSSRQILEMDSDINMWLTRFNFIYKWIILENDILQNLTNITSYFTNVKLRMDSDVAFIPKHKNTNEVIIYDIYNPGFGENGGKIIINKMLFYNITRKFIKIENKSMYDNRKNMSKLIIKSTTTITKNISTTPEEFLVNRIKIDSVNKLNYALFLHIIGIHEFKNIIVPTRLWYGPSASGIDGGMTNHLWYKIADVSANAGIMTRERVTAVDYLISTYYFGTCFIFRNPSAIGKIRNQFFDPFALKTWMVCLFFWILLCVTLKVTFNIHSKFGNAKVEHTSWSSSILNTLAAFCQQDIETDENNLTGRILILCLMVLSLMLYNYYTSSIVSDLINSRTQAFTTIGELVHSSMDLGMEDIGYTERLFKTTVDSDIIYLRDKKILVPGKEKQYLPPEEGIARMKAGGFAYHVEPATGYPLIAKSFDGAEICDLCEIYVFKQCLIYVLAQKKSQYKKLFSIRKMMNFGIMRRESRIWQAQKPECLSSANVLQIELEQVAPAFFVLLFGLVFSLCILFIEIKRTNNLNN